MLTLLFGPPGPCRDALEAALRARGHGVHLAEDVASAEALFQDERLALVVLAEASRAVLARCRALQGEGSPPAGVGAQGAPVVLAVAPPEAGLRDALAEHGVVDDLIFSWEHPEQLRTRLLLAEKRVRQRGQAARRPHQERARIREAQEALRESEAKARAVIETTVDGVITIDEYGRIESFNPAAEAIFGYEEAEVIGKNVKVLMPDPYRAEHDDYLRSYRETGRRMIIGIGREVVGRRKGGATFPMDLAVSEVPLNGRRIFTGVVRDITERRRLEQEILKASEQERRRVGQDLHDGLGQMLTGIGLISQNLTRRLQAEDHAAASDAGEITEMIQEADEQARGLARGLVPVDLEASGLAEALRRLARNAAQLFGVECAFESEGQALIYDNTVATHLYRIAQEAVSNAVKHGRASHVSIVLAVGAKRVRLRVKDDGRGFPEEEAARHESETEGMGVRIMHHRAHMIGASLEVRNGSSGRGAVVTCTMRRPA